LGQGGLAQLAHPWPIGQNARECGVSASGILPDPWQNERPVCPVRPDPKNRAIRPKNPKCRHRNDLAPVCHDSGTGLALESSPPHGGGGRDSPPGRLRPAERNRGRVPRTERQRSAGSPQTVMVWMSHGRAGEPTAGTSTVEAADNLRPDEDTDASGETGTRVGAVSWTQPPRCNRKQPVGRDPDPISNGKGRCPRAPAVAVREPTTSRTQTESL
jgi:hypothetical protein